MSFMLISLAIVFSFLLEYELPERQKLISTCWVALDRVDLLKNLYWFTSTIASPLSASC